jgi:hypothetical protein
MYSERTRPSRAACRPVSSTPRGAYGFKITGDSVDSALYNPVDEDRPTIQIIRRDLTRENYGIVSGSEKVEIPLIGGGAAIIERATGLGILEVPNDLTADELAHPYLAPIASVFADWLKYTVLHAGIVHIANKAWGVVGAREAGKSTLMAGLAIKGLPIGADDLMVIDGEEVFSGPRTLDLRPGAAEYLKEGRGLGVVGMRERWRLDLDDAAPSLPLGGFIFPSWGDEISVAPCPLTVRLDTFVNGRSVQVDPMDPREAMRLARYPAYDFVRPQDWDLFDDGTAALVGAIEATVS